MQVLGSLAGGGGLGGVTLGRAQVGDVLDQRGEPQYERYLGKVRVAGERRGGQEPGGPAQAVPGGSSARDAAVWMAGGAVIGVGGLAQHRAAQRRRGRVQRVGGGPGCIGGADRVRGREGSDVCGGVGGCAGGVLPDRVPFLRRELATRCGAGWFSAAAEPGQGQIGGELPAAEPHRTTRRGVRWQGDGVAGDLARVAGAEPLTDQDPGVR